MQSKLTVLGFLWLVLLAAPSTASDLTAGFLDLLQPGLPRDGELGGDPFAVPVGDQRGWWRRGTVGTSGRGLRWQWLEHQPVTRRLADDGGEARYRELELALGYRVGPLRGVLQASRQDLDVNLTPDPDHYIFGGAGNQLAAALRAETGDGAWTLQGTAPLAHESATVRDAPLGVGLRYRLVDRLQLEAAWVESPLNYALDFTILDAEMATTVNCDRRQLSLAWDWRPATVLAFSGRAAHTDLSQLHPTTDALAYELDPTGRCESVLAAVSATPGDRWTVTARGTYDELDLEGEAFWGGQRFATLSHAWGDVASLLLAARYRTGESLALIGDVQASRLRGDGRLSVRSWPFTDALIDLLGVTAVGRARVECNWQRYHVAVQDRTPTRRLEAGFAWFNLFPEATLREMHSAPFGIGAEVTWHHLGTDHVQLGAVILGCEFTWGRWLVGGDLYQFVAANARDNRGDEPVEPPVEPPQPPAPRDEPGGWYGGTYGRLRVGIGF